jgi:hypothetical protein
MVTAALVSFHTQVQKVTVLTGAEANADFKLDVGAAAEVVHVTSDTAQVNRTDYKIDGVVTREQIERLPLNGRSFLELAQLEPGVEVTAVANPGTSPNSFFRVSIAGAAAALTRVSVDGATVNDRITGGTAQNFSQETVQEFQITTFNFDLATSVTGVGAVNVVSRTGSNAVHGSGFFFFRDHNLAAYPGFKRDPRDPDPFFARRQSGFALGGPIKKDKLFWFTNFENNNQMSVFTIAHSHPVFFPFDHIGQAPFRGKLFNVRLDDKLSDKHTAFLRYSQDTNRNVSANSNLESNWIVTRNFAAQALLGVTSILTPRLVNDLRYSYQFYSGHLNPPTASDCTNALGCLGVGGPRINLSGTGFQIGNNDQIPQHRILRTYQLTDNVTWARGNHRWRWGGEWEHFNGIGSWGYRSAGVITLFGPEAVRLNNPELYDALPETLRSTTAGTPTLADILRLPFSSLQIGVGDIRQPPGYHLERARRNNRYRLFVQDTWRVRPRLTLSLGLAWSFEDNLLNYDLDKPEYLRPLLGDLRPPRHDYKNFQPALGFAWVVDQKNKTVLRGGGGVYYDSNFFYSRLRERSVIGPAGNGLVPLPGSIVPNPFFGQPGQPRTLNFSTPTSTNGQQILNLLPDIRSALLALVGNGQDLSTRGIEVFKTGDGIFDRHTTTPYTIHATVGIQREIVRAMILQADFVMRRGVHFGGLHDSFAVDLNHYNRPKVMAVDPTTGAVTFVRDPVIPLCTSAQMSDPKAQCSSGEISVYRSAANYRYTGLLVKLDKRFTTRYQFTLSYAFSRNTGWNGVINLDNLYASQGFLSSDRPHLFTFSGIWNLPSYRGGSLWARNLLDGWQVSTIHQMRSALPLNATIGVDLDGNGVSTLVLPGLKYNGFGRSTNAEQLRALVDQFNATYPTAVTGRRTPQNQAVPVIKLPDRFASGDPFFSTDIRLSRIFTVRDRLKLTFLAEGFNVFNVANLSGYRSGLDALVTSGVQPATFGQPTTRTAQVFGTGGARAFQFGARFTF